MKILAPLKDSISKSLKRFGLTDKQVSLYLPRILLLLDWIGPKPKRVSSQLFRCFTDKITVRKKKFNLLTVLKRSKILRCSSKHIQNVRCSEYRVKGPFIQQELEASEDDLQRLQDAQRKLQESSETSTLEWLNKACQHQFYRGTYLCNSIPTDWHIILLQAADAALLYSYIENKIRHPNIFTDSYKNGLFFQALIYFYRSAPMSFNKSSLEDSSTWTEYKRMIDQWRFQHEFLQKLTSDRCDLVNYVVKQLSDSNTPAACDGTALYSPDKESLQVAFCDWVLRRTSVNLMEKTFDEWVRTKPLMKKDIRYMVVPYINDAIEPLEREIAFLYPKMAFANI